SHALALYQQGCHEVSTHVPCGSARPLIYVQMLEEGPIRPEEEGAGVVVWGDIVGKTRIVPKARRRTLPECRPGACCPTQQVLVELLKEGIIDRNGPHADGRNDLRLRRLVKDAVEQRIPPAIPEIHQSCGAWHTGDGLGDIRTMSAVHNHLGWET